MGRTGAAYISKANRLDAEIIALKANMNEMYCARRHHWSISTTQPYQSWDMFADDLIRELSQKKFKNELMKTPYSIRKISALIINTPSMSFKGVFHSNGDLALYTSLMLHFITF